MPMLESDAAYALWADHYPPIPHNALMQIEQQAVIALLPPVAHLTAADVGCGTGRYLRLLKARGGGRLLGIDRSAAMLAHVEHGAVVQGDTRALPLATASLDIVVSGLALNDDEELATAVGELGRVLRPGGVLVYSALHPRGAAARWTRTFEAYGQTWSLPVFWHSLTAHQQACMGAQLAIEQWMEPALADRGPVALVIKASRR
jgi:malonyl-CoA O-methyltransferase